jgi:L-threonylcarbamoyladenylate synthase
MVDNHPGTSVKIILGGGLVAFPTETVYGLGADASNDAAVRRVFEAKGRPADHPLIVHIGTAEEISRWARDVPEETWALVDRFWPGPLTLILKRAENVSDILAGGQDTIGLRMPAHPVALALLRAVGRGIAAPSANRFGRISPTTAEHVRSELGDRVDLILDGGACEVGLESTILDLSGEHPCVLRPGAVTQSMLEEVLPVSLARPASDAPRVPGSLASHYAPLTPLMTVSSAALEGAVIGLLQSGRDPVVLSIGPDSPTAGARVVVMPRLPADYARELYARLREADSWGCSDIVVEMVPDEPSWAAVIDRLGRASCPSGPE